MADTNGKLKIFLCHASENQPIVKELYDRLVRAGYEPWMDSEILPGMDANLEVRKALRASDAVIVCLSKISVAKEGRIQLELKLAREIEQEKLEGAIFLIPLRLEQVDIPFSLRGIQWGDYTAPNGFEQLVRSLNIRAGQLGREKGQVVPPTEQFSSDTDRFILETLTAAKAIVADMKAELPSSRYFEFGDNPKIVGRIDRYLDNLFRVMNDLRNFYEAKPLKESNPYFEAIRIMHDFRVLLQRVRDDGGGKIENTTQARKLISDLEQSLERLSGAATAAKEVEPVKAKSEPPEKRRSSEYEQSVFISYAWGEPLEVIVNQIDDAFQKRGIKIIRDKRDAGYKASIKEFMERIGQGDCVIIVISDKYLRSPNCMFELVEIAKNKEFRERAFPVVLAGANIYQPLRQLEYIKYWENEIKELKKGIKGVDPSNLSGIYRQLDLYDDIRDNISKLIDILGDMNTLTPEMHRDSDFSQLYDAVEKRLKEQREK